MLASTSVDSFLRPEALADALDLWSLRREKVLELLDVRASRTGRQLARTCRLLAQHAYAKSISSDAWVAEWRQTREEVAALLRGSRPSVRTPSTEVDAVNQKSAMDRAPVVSTHDISTRSVDWSEMEHLDGERPTRIAEHGWIQSLKVA